MYENFVPNIETRRPRLEVKIREAQPLDILKLASLVSTRHQIPLNECIEGLKRQLERHDNFKKLEIYVALHEQEVVGFGKINYFDPSDHEKKYQAPAGWYLAGIIIDDNFRRRGIGSKLTAIRINKIRSRAKEVFYFADSQNKVSIEFHKKFGFDFLTNDFSYPNSRFTPDNPPALFVKKF